LNIDFLHYQFIEEENQLNVNKLLVEAFEYNRDDMFVDFSEEEMAQIELGYA
jgi:hypothetical protein